jgi:phospholipid/cholesterol/gamma-HCH transport system substrate-binding protein
MPSAKRVAWAQLRVGIMAFAALVLLGVLVFLLTGTKGLFVPQQVIYTFMGDSAAMTSGAPVRLNGILVGKVAAVELTGSTDPLRIVRFTLSINEKDVPGIPTDSQAAVSAENVLGTKYINIRKGTAATAVKPGGEISSKDVSDFEEVVASGYSAVQSLQGLIKRLDGILSQVESGKGSIGKFLTDDELYRRLTATVGEAHKLTESMNAGKGTVGRLLNDEALFDDMRKTLARLDAFIDDIQASQGTFGKLLRDPALYDDLRQTVGEVRTMVADLNAGKGTAGKFLKSEEMHGRVLATIGRVDTLLDKMNAGQGTLGQLLANPQMYENINGATRELNALMKDFRANPKKFLTIQLKLF